MIKVYFFLLILGVFGAVGYGAYMYYKDTQSRIATLTENNAKLETAIQVSEESVATLQKDITKNAELNNKLQKELHKAEKYGDELRAKVQASIENATNKLWDDFSIITAPNGVQPDTRTKNTNSN